MCSPELSPFFVSMPSSAMATGSVGSGKILLSARSVPETWLHPEPHRVDLRKIGSVRSRKAEKGDDRQQHGGKGTQETSVKWTSTG